MVGKIGLRSLMFGVVALASLMCGPPPPPPIVFTPLSKLADLGSETSAAYARSRASGLTVIPGTLLVERNNKFNPDNAWSWSTDGGSSWIPCTVNTCGLGGSPTTPVAVQMASSTLPSPFGSIPVTQVDWRGDPGIAASPDGRTVVMSNLANTTAPPLWTKVLNGVVLSTSIDGGHTFINTVFANMPPVDSDCAAGDSVDQPSLTADPLVPNRYFVAWRWQATSLGVAGACGASFDVSPTDGSVTLGTLHGIDVSHPTFESVGGLIVQTRGDEVTVVYANNSVGGDENCDGPTSMSWGASTSLDRGVSWNNVLIADDNYPFPPNTEGQLTCLPDSVNGVVQTGIRNFAFTRDLFGTMWVALPRDGNAGFTVFKSVGTGMDAGVTWSVVQDVLVDNAFTFHPAMASDNIGRVGLVFQVLGTRLTGGFGFTTWFAAIPAGLNPPFVGPVPISGGYVGDNPPPQGSCSHPICSTGSGLLPGCDGAPNTCVATIDAANLFCQLSWDRSCAYQVGNVTGGTCGQGAGFTCGGRVLGDYNGMAAIPIGDIPGVTATFMPAWTFGAVTSSGYDSTVTGALVQVSP